MDTLTLNSPIDMHLHLRQGDMLKTIAPLGAPSFSAAVIMPNTVPPVTTPQGVSDYRREIEAALGPETMAPLMTLFFRNFSEQELVAAKESIFGIKLYPAGATTNSDGGVGDLDAAESTFKLMEEMDIPLLVHGEQALDFVMDREKNFLPLYRRLAEKYPKLRISMEHITTAAALELLDRHENLMATVTLQHLEITLDDVAGGMLNPHLFCKPIAKRPEDRDALLHAALSAHPKLMFGSDSAPHPRDKKECCGCAAGVFSAPIAIPYLAHIFDSHGALDKLQAFVHDNAVRLHGLEVPNKKVRLEKTPFTIPQSYGEVVPFMAGKTINWSLI